MALAFADRVRETTTTTGTGTITLAGAVTGYQSFSAIGNGNTTYYTINAGSQWEVGIGTYTASGTTLSRDTVLSSSNAGALVDFSAGTKDVFVGYPADKVVIQDASGNVGIGTSSPAGKFSSNTGANGTYVSVPGNVTGWDATTSLFGAANSTTGAAVGIGMTAAGGYISSLAPSVAWQNLHYQASTHYWYNGVTQLGVLNTAGDFTAVGSVRAPIFYDSGNTAYYLDPTGSTSLNVAGNMLASGNLTLNNGANRYVRIGSATNYSYDLQTTGDDFQIIEAGTTPRLTIKYPSGNLGVGTASPSARITAQINSGNYLLDLVNGSETGFALRTYNHGSASAPGLVFTQGLYYGTTENAAVKYYRGGGGTGGYLGFTTYNGTEQLSINNSGNVTATVDLRAPIFYDSNNTGYYVDPASTSNLNDLVIASGNVLGAVATFNNMNQPHTTQTDFNAITNFGVRYVQGPTNGPGISGATQYYGFSLGLGSDYAYSSYASQFYWPRASLGGNPYPSVRFREGGSWGAWSKIYAGWADAPSGSTFAATGDFRAPVFYDSQDTSYFLDPNSTSVLSTVRASTIQFSSGNTAIVLNNASYQILYDPTARPAIYLGGADPGNYYDNTGHYFRDRNGNQYAYITSSGMYAPVFYDSANTAYYVDAGANSVMNAIYMRNSSGGNGLLATGSTFGYSASYKTVVLGNESLTTISMGVDVSGNASGSFNGTGQGREVIFRNGVNFITPNSANNSYLNPMNMTDGYVSSGGSFRAPIFYDSNDTGRYLDPASTSALNTVLVNSGLGVYDSSNNDPYGKLSVTRSSGANYTYLAFTRSGQTAMGMGIDTSNAFWIGGSSAGYDGTRVSTWISITPSGNVTAPVDIRAPIFYDSSNTAYYLDPASTSLLNEVKGYRFYNPQGVSSDDPFGLYFSSDLSTAYAIYRESGAWTHPYPDLRIAFHTGIKMGANASYGGMKFYTDYDMSSQVMSINNSADGLGGGNVFVNSSLVAASSLRAPIFYDSDNTAYYTNPAGTSYVSGEFQVQQSSTNGIRLLSTTGTQSLWIRAGYDTDGSATPVVSATNIQFQSSGSSGGSFTFVSGNTKALTITGDYAQGGANLRAPIFYDSNNTGFYIDAASTSNINQLNGNGKIVLETSDSFLRINQYNGFSNGIWMGPSNIGGSGELHLGSNGTPSTARVRVIGGTYNGSVVITLNGADGSITAAGNVTAYSDIRVKDNVETVPAALAKLSAIRGVTYTRTDLDDKERRYAGVIAQEIEQVLPEAVREINDIKTVDYNATIALLIQAVKELSAKVEALEAKEY